MELRCANDTSGNLSGWGPSEYLFPVYYYRALPYDPPRPWKDWNGKWYLAISTDGCNATSPPVPASPRLGSKELLNLSGTWLNHDSVRGVSTVVLAEGAAAGLLPPGSAHHSLSAQSMQPRQAHWTTAIGVVDGAMTHGYLAFDNRSSNNRTFSVSADKNTIFLSTRPGVDPPSFSQNFTRDGPPPPPPGSRSKPCKAGGRLDLWTSPRLRGADASWQQIGPMLTANANPLDNTGYNEFVTTDYFGSVPGKYDSAFKNLLA